MTIDTFIKIMCIFAMVASYMIGAIILARHFKKYGLPIEIIEPVCKGEDRFASGSFRKTGTMYKPNKSTFNVISSNDIDESLDCSCGHYNCSSEGSYYHTDSIDTRTVTCHDGTTIEYDLSHPPSGWARDWVSWKKEMETEIQNRQEFENMIKFKNKEKELLNKIDKKYNMEKAIKAAALVIAKQNKDPLYDEYEKLVKN